MKNKLYLNLNVYIYICLCINLKDKIDVTDTIKDYFPIILVKYRVYLFRFGFRIDDDYFVELRSVFAMTTNRFFGKILGITQSVHDSNASNNKELPPKTRRLETIARRYFYFFINNCLYVNIRNILFYI